MERRTLRPRRNLVLRIKHTILSQTRLPTIITPHPRKDHPMNNHGKHERPSYGVSFKNVREARVTKDLLYIARQKRIKERAKDHLPKLTIVTHCIGEPLKTYEPKQNHMQERIIAACRAKQRELHPPCSS